MIFTSQIWHTIDLLTFKELIFEVNEDNVLGLKKNKAICNGIVNRKNPFFVSRFGESKKTYL